MFCGRVYFLECHKDSQNNCLNMKLIKTMMEMLTWTGEIPGGLNPTQSTTDKQGKLRTREIFFSREEHIN